MRWGGPAALGTPATDPRQHRKTRGQILSGFYPQTARFNTVPSSPPAPQSTNECSPRGNRPEIFACELGLRDDYHVIVDPHGKSGGVVRTTLPQSATYAVSATRVRSA